MNVATDADSAGAALEGRRAVVTGASRGIGYSVAAAFAKAGADLAVVTRDAASLNAVADELQAHGRRVVAVPCDVTIPDQVTTLHRAVVEQLGGVDILVNNAGTGESHAFLNHPDDLWHHMLLANLTSVYYVTKAFVPEMVAQRYGRIINMASMAAKVGARYLAAYTAAKHGVLGLTRVLAAELVSYAITVNAICPGYVDTPLTGASIARIAARTGRTEADARRALEQMNPQRRLIDPAEVAAVALFLAQDSAAGITGQAINVDGGAVMW